MRGSRTRDTAAAYLAYRGRLHDDAQQAPDPIWAPLASKQGPALRQADKSVSDAAPAGTVLRLWFAPNTGQPTKGPDVPPDLAEVFAAIDAARHAILLLCFNPGTPSVIDRAVAAALARPDLLMQGAVSAPEVLPRPKPAKQTITLPNGRTVTISPPAVTPAAIDGHPAIKLLMVRASALRVQTGDLQPELLTTGHATIHNKIIVIDPMQAESCVVVTGSHILGYNTSYCNDENLVILRGNQPLAAAYAAHVLDMLEHYRFRAVQEERDIVALRTTGAPPPADTGGGFLHTDDGWQAGYFDGSKGGNRDYFLG